MDIFEAIKGRRSIRSYLGINIEEEKLRRVLEAGRLAPSARNLQDWRFIVVRDPAKRRKLAEAAFNQMFIAQAPVVIAACGTSDYVMPCGQYTHVIDVSIALDHMILAAYSEGLGTCWIGAFYEDLVKEILGVPEHIRVVALLPLGYPADLPRPTSRKGLEDVVAYEGW